MFSSTTLSLLAQSLPILLSILPTTTLAAPAASPLTPSPFLQLSPNPSLSSLQLNDSSNGNCASAPRFSFWRSAQAEKWNVEDCYAAVNRLYISEVLKHPDQSYEFVAKGGMSKRPELEKMNTPRKYVEKTCTLTVMMLSWFPPHTLPASPVHQVWPQTDVSSFKKIYVAAKNIESLCTETKVPGWSMVGDGKAMGVFIWPTDSEINEWTGGFPVSDIAGS